MTSTADAWARESPCQRKATACEGDSYSLEAMESATSCECHGPETMNCVSSVVDCQTRWTSENGTEAVGSPSRAIAAV